MASAATVSPPPATDSKALALVSAAASFATATVARSNGGVSKAPSGPFQTSVLQRFISATIASTVFGPTSRIILSGGTDEAATVATGGLALNSAATTASTDSRILQFRACAFARTSRAVSAI